MVIDISNAFDSVYLDAVLDTTVSPTRIFSFVRCLLSDWLFAVKTLRENIARVTCFLIAGITQESVILSTLFNISLIPLAWKLNKIEGLGFRYYIC